MKTELFNKRILFDWKDCPYLLIEPEEIIKASANDFKTVSLMYAKALDSLPVCGKQIIDLNVWTALKMWAYDCLHSADLNKACFVMGSKEIRIGFQKKNFLEIGLVSFQEKYGMKITAVNFENGKFITTLENVKHQINKGERDNDES